MAPLQQWIFSCILVVTISLLYSSLLPANTHDSNSHKSNLIPHKQLFTELSMNELNTTYTVYGSSNVLINADRTQITATIQVIKALNTPVQQSLGESYLTQTKLTVQSEVANLTTGVIHYLNSAVIQPYIHRLHTASVSLRPNLQWTNNTEYITGYTGSNTIQFQVDINQSSTIYDKIITHGVTTIDSVIFTLSDKLNTLARQQGIDSAIKDGLVQLNTIQHTLTSDTVNNLHLSGNRYHIQSVVVESLTSPTGTEQQTLVPMMHSAMGMYMPTASTPLIGSLQSIKANVKLVAQLI